MTVLVVDGANVVGARADGWWKDRAGAARRLHEQLVIADLDPEITDVVLVLEGEAKGGVRKGRDGHVTVVHAPQDGDSEIMVQLPGVDDPARVRQILQTAAVLELYEVKDGQPSLVNFQVQSGTYVVPKVLDRGNLALGKDKFSFQQGK